MIRRTISTLTALALIALTLIAEPAAAATSPAKGTGPAAAPGKRTTTKRTTGPTTAPARTAGGPRRLEDIHIAGEIPAPQVLFITARDQRRFMGSKHRQYLRTAREVAEATPLPSTVIVTRPAPAADAPSSGPR